MKLTKVESTSIDSIGWEKESLTIKFKNSNIYIYKEVPEEVFNKMLNAESKGKFFLSEIKNKYKFEKEATKLR